MKKLITLLCAFIMTVMSFACETPNGYRKYQIVTVCFSYTRGVTDYREQMLYQSVSDPSRFRLCWADRTFEVIPANKQGRDQGYRYMIWDTSLPIYFNIDD